jgi:hypothetical protein
MRRSARIRVVSASIGEAFRSKRKTLEQGGPIKASLTHHPRESRRSD